VSRPQFYQIPSITSRAAQPSVARWYSAEAESSPKDAAEAPKEGESKNATADSEAALQKQLEEKEAEIRDWKVRHVLPSAP
jgi:molecular chaperone GrpE